MDKQTLQQYIESKKNAWSPATLRSVHAKLRVNLDLFNQGPEALYTKGIQLYAPYTVKTLFILVGEFYEFIHGSQAHNPFKAYRYDNALLFKNVYKATEAPVEFAEAKRRIEQLQSPYKELAYFILNSGLRAQEAITYDGSGTVIGKGATPRRVFSEAPYPTGHSVTYSMLHKALAKVGLKPHDLRKLYANELVNCGLKEMDLLKVMGWTNYQTATKYLAPKKDAELNNLLKGRFR